MFIFAGCAKRHVKVEFLYHVQHTLYFWMYTIAGRFPLHEAVVCCGCSSVSAALQMSNQSFQGGERSFSAHTFLTVVCAYWIQGCDSFIINAVTDPLGLSFAWFNYCTQHVVSSSFGLPWILKAYIRLLLLLLLFQTSGKKLQKHKEIILMLCVRMD